MSANNKELIDALRVALEVSPESVALYKHLAGLLVDDGDFAEAIKLYRKALDLTPDDAQLKLALAQAYGREGRTDVALVVLEQLMREPSAPAPTYVLAARAYLETGELDLARRSYREAVTRDVGGAG